MQVRLTDSNAKGIKRLAGINHRSWAGEANVAVEEYLAKHREGMRRPKLNSNTKTKTP